MWCARCIYHAHSVARADPSDAAQIELELTQLRAVCQLRELPTAASGGSGTLPQMPPRPLAAVAAANYSAATAATTAAASALSAAGEAVAASPGESLVELEKVTDALAASALVPRDSQPSAQAPDAAGPRPATGAGSTELPGDAGIVFGEQSLTLRGGERVRLRLQLWPRRPGLLTVDGIAWVLAGVAPGQRLFSLRSRAPGSKCVSTHALTLLLIIRHERCSQGFAARCPGQTCHGVRDAAWLLELACEHRTSRGSCARLVIEELNPVSLQVGEGVSATVSVSGRHPGDAAIGRRAGGPAAGAPLPLPVLMQPLRTLLPRPVC